ncbi:MAG: PAS domain-containing protein [Chloroflexota bacterium]
MTIALLGALLRPLQAIRQAVGGSKLPRVSTAEHATLADELGAVRATLAGRTTELRAALADLACYRLFAERLTDSVLFVEADGTIADANPAAIAMYGYERADLVGRSVYDLLAGPDERLGDDQLARAYREGLVFEATHRRRDETVFRADVTLVGAAPADAADADGSEITGPRIAIVRDVSAHQAVQLASARLLVREQEARAREERAAEVTGIIQHMPCGVLVFDRDGCLTLANERALEILSLDAPPENEDDALLDRSPIPHPSLLLENRLLSPCRALVARALGGSVVDEREIQIEAPGAEDLILLGSAAPLRTTRGDVCGAVVTISDVSRERRLMQDLVLSEGTLRHTLESLLLLHEAGRALSATLVEEEIGRRFAESCVRIARLDGALVFLKGGPSDDADHGSLRLIATNGDPLLIDHVLTCPDEQQARATTLQGSESGDIRAIPACAELSIALGHHIELAARGRTLGVLEIYGTEQLTTVTRDALASLAAHAVSAFENAHLYREVADREQRLQDALRQLLIAQEEERRRIAYELHDGLAQVAAATHLSLQTFASQYRPRAEQTRQQLERSVELARRVVREARQVIAGLRPTTLDDFGLERALRLHVQELVGEGWTIDYVAQIGPGRLPGPVETVLYRIAQEALTNVRKHAETLDAQVTLRRLDGRVQLEVIDHGAGFNSGAFAEIADPGHHVGLVAMRERAALVGGVCTVQSRPGEGTRVSATIPLAAEPELASPNLPFSGDRVTTSGTPTSALPPRPLVPAMTGRSFEEPDHAI